MAARCKTSSGLPGGEPAKAHVDNERGIAELAIAFEISQIHDCTSYSGRPGQPRFAVLFRGNNRCFRRYSVESRGERRIRQVVSKSENDAGDREPVTISIALPLFRLARNCPSFSAAAPKTSSKLHGNSLFGEIIPPVSYAKSSENRGLRRCHGSETRLNQKESDEGESGTSLQPFLSSCYHRKR
jgi:hypothetical protein